ncbi:MAG: bifunctional precorrin-2 dehydrogenase/sirohydrochlorin ferrochelatase [Deltaproteobacteria bacterium]|nr:bifunctional precorrin-2 dehydrogenase/sirohydrochlorin ferrochelatase [Deltaproteobacteria bacterium]
MKYYPINLDINNRECLVVRAGSVGTRKVKTLIDCSARVTVVSPEVSDEILSLETNNRIKVKKRPYKAQDLEGMFLVIGATGDESTNRKISLDAGRLNLLYNIADLPEACNFILPAIVKKGDLLISISTSGKSPAFAKKLRKDLEKQFGEEYSLFLKLMGCIRKKLLSEKHEPEAHKHFFEAIIEKGLLDLIKEKKTGDIDTLLYEVLGDGYEYKKLMENG